MEPALPSTELLSDVASAVDSVRPIGSTYTVIPPQVLTANVSLMAQFTSADAVTPAITAIEAQITSYLNTLPIGASASITRVAQRAYMASSEVQNISGVELNGGSVDLVPAPLTVIKAGQVMVSVNDG